MKYVLTVLSALFILSCTDVILPANPSEYVWKDKIEFRVTGNAITTRIRYEGPDGLQQVISTLPFNTEFTSTKSSIFLTLEALPLNYPIPTLFPFLSVQIIVNGNIFREATFSDFTTIPISVSGTFKH